MNKIEESKNVKAMLDKLDKNKNPFTVPENYFEGLTKDIMGKLPVAEEIKQTKKVSLWKKIAPWTGVAAVIAAVAIAVNLTGSMPTMVAEKPSDDTEQTAKNQLAYNEVEDYLLFLEDEAVELEYREALFAEE